MSDPTPRKRRSQSPPPARGGSPLPWVALVIGVIVAGLGIGALISAYQNRGTPPPQLGAGIPPVTPVPQPSAAPDESPLAMPSATPSPEPTASPSPSPKPTPSPTPVPTSSPTASPAPAPDATPSPAPTASATPVATAPPTPKPTAAPTAKPTVAPTVKPTVAPTVKPAAAPAAPAAEPHAAPEATATVRRYLDAVIGGNTSSAAAMLAPGGTVKEAAVLDNASHVTSVRVTRSDATGSFVDAEIATSSGSYIATFHVTAGGMIDQHDYIKV